MARPKGVQGIRWSTEQVSWMKLNGPLMGDKQLADEFERRFGVRPSLGQIRGIRYRYQIAHPPASAVPPVTAIKGRLAVATTRLGVAMTLVYEAADELDRAGVADKASDLRLDVAAVAAYIPPPPRRGGGRAGLGASAMAGRPDARRQVRQLGRQGKNQTPTVTKQACRRQPARLFLPGRRPATPVQTCLHTTFHMVGSFQQSLYIDVEKIFNTKLSCNGTVGLSLSEEGPRLWGMGTNCG